ncbi:MAG: hypothetical protein PUI26_03195 [Selenomonadaceae bacterium]|nr:hypothetical protein [Selenomonadaceae bacterium]
MAGAACSRPTRYRLKPFDANASDAGHFDRYDDIALASFTYCF